MIATATATATWTDREQSQAEAAVQRSASCDEIVHLDYTDGLAYLLREWAEDHVDAVDVVEFWCSADEDERQFQFAGGSWRVHLDRRGS